MSNGSAVFTASPARSLRGSLKVPGDKSISHRSIMLASLADGESRVTGFLNGEDCLATMKAFQAMGVSIDRVTDTELRIHGVGLHGLKKPAGDLYLGNSGTSMRLMSGLMSAQAFDVVMTGDASLSGRPMRRVTSPLAAMGAEIDGTEKGTPPLRVTGGQRLRGLSYEMPVASAQVKSCILLAGIYAEGETSVTEPAPSRDHTERMLQGFGYSVEREGATVTLSGGGALKACDVDVPSDISSAAFFLVGGCIAEESELTLKHVGINPTRTGVIDILKLMGGDIELQNESLVGGEPVADLIVRSSPLKGIDIPEELVPLAIDEFPALFIAAACADGPTRLTGAEELRVKESDRIQVMADGLEACGIAHEVLSDGITINGGQRFQSGEIDSHGDHRIAMAFAMASLRSDGVIKISDCDNVNTSFPGFVALANSAGLSIEVSDS